MLKILITGTAGFIGYHLVHKLAKMNHLIVGIDNINDYYDPQLKYDRLKDCGIDQELIGWNSEVKSSKYDNYTFIRLNLEDKNEINALCGQYNFDIIVNLAAQAGVRYSLESPDTYIQSNIVGFMNILEAARHYKVNKVVYASSSSVYGLNKKMPFSVEDKTDQPVSLYAASKKSNELMAHTYSHLFGIKTVGLRFFTVYGPWGRPDMALYLFTNSIFEGKPINVFNGGNLSRDFTYIDDIIEGVASSVLVDDESLPLCEVYNIGNSSPVQLEDFISAIEKHSAIKAEKNYLPMQPGDVVTTWADVSDFSQNYNYTPTTNVDKGVELYINWFKEYYKVKTNE